MSRQIASYKQIPSNAVQIEWYVYDRSIPADGVIKQWAKNKDINVSVSMYIVKKLVDETIANGSILSVNFYWHSPYGQDGTFLHGLAKKIKYTTDIYSDGIEIAEEFVIEGYKVAGAVELACAIVLDSCPNESSSYSVYATEPGTILYEESTIITIEGTQALFPVIATDFHNLEGIAPDSLYFLKRKYSQLDSNFTSSYKLYFNSAHPLFNVVNSDNENDETAQYLLKLIMYDVYRCIVEDALSENGLQDVFIDEENMFSLQSIYSKIIISLQKSFFSDKDIEALRNMLHSGKESERNALYTAIQQYIMED